MPMHTLTHKVPSRNYVQSTGQRKGGWKYENIEDIKRCILLVSIFENIKFI